MLRDVTIFTDGVLAIFSLVLVGDQFSSMMPVGRMNCGPALYVTVTLSSGLRRFAATCVADSPMQKYLR